MSREYSPKPGHTWEHHVAGNEQHVDTTGTDGNQPQPPRPNRATRRAAARANRQKGHRR